MNKGFTLIELLAVIVILAIIALIAVPIVIHIIDDTKTSSEKESVELYIDSVKKAVARKQLEKNNFNPTTCEIQEDGNLLCGDTEIAVDMKGTKAINGIIEFSNGKIIEEETWIKMSNNSYYCYKNNKITKLTEDEIKLPKEYQKVEYIESTGTQYIDVQFIPNQDTKVEMNFTTTTSGRTEVYFGSRVNYNINTYCFIQNSNKFRSDYDNDWRNSTSSNINDLVGYPNFLIIKDRNKTTINNNIVILSSYGYFSSQNSLYIFSVNDNGVAKLYSNMRLYWFKVYDNDTLVRDFVPVIDSSGIPCLYDKVEDKFYYNEGTGEFIKGPDV